jgi:hypothetical protein
MARYTLDMVLEYAKVFPENADMGNPDGPQWQKAIADKGGQYVVNAYFTNQEQIDRLMMDGFKATVMGNARIQEGNVDFGIGKYMKIKRQVRDDIRDWKDPLTGTNANLGGPVKVVDLRQGRDNVSKWDFNDHGELGNGTKAKVQFETYADGNGLRLNGIAVTELVERTNEPSDDDMIFAAAV